MRTHGDPTCRHRRPLPNALRRMGQEALEHGGRQADRPAQISPSAICAFAVSNSCRLAYDFLSFARIKSPAPVDPVVGCGTG